MLFTLILVGILVGAVVCAAVVGFLIHQASVRSNVLARVHAENKETGTEDPALRDSRGNLLSRWLAHAGFRSPAASWVFILATFSTVAVGAIICLLFIALGLASLMVQTLSTLPNVGEIFVPVAYLAPAFLFLFIATIPWLYVRQARRARIQMIEQDLPTSLDLMATLSEAGLGFDAAVARILETRLDGRPLAGEYRRYLADQLAGRSRVDCLRRLADRVQVQSVTIFVSALVQSEQMGTGIAQVLRRQAEDLRDRRRQQANAFAMTLPVKRMLPLVVCFLPAIFVWTLGPAFVQLFKIAESFIQVRNF